MKHNIQNEYFRVQEFRVLSMFQLIVKPFCLKLFQVLKQRPVENFQKFLRMLTKIFFLISKDVEQLWGLANILRAKNEEMK